MKHIEAISNGLGSQSTMLLLLASEGKIPCDVSITGDTGAEEDRLWSNGRRTSARVYFDEVIEPYAKSHGIDAVMVRTQTRNGPSPSITEVLRSGKVPIPMFGSNGGRLPQHCTGKWKIRAVRQELRRRGAKTARVALGLTKTEVHRMKPSDRKWVQNWWPLITDYPMNRAEVRAALEKRGIPYLITTECDFCPHKDLARWRRTSDEKLKEIIEIENSLDGLFFTPARIPLRESLKYEQLSLFDDSCDEGYCFV